MVLLKTVPATFICDEAPIVDLICFIPDENDKHDECCGLSNN